METVIRSSKRIAVAVIAVLLGGVSPFYADEPGPPPSVKIEVDAAQAAMRSNDWAAVVEHYSKAAELAPRDLEVQEAFILYHRAGNLRVLKKDEVEKRFKALRDRYRRMAQREPNDPLWQFLLGSVQFYEDPHASERAYERAVELDPNHVKALQMLGVLATTRGENDRARRYYERAAAAAPDDPGAVGMLVGSVREQGYESFQRAALDLIERFPNSSEAAKWYYWLGADAPSAAEKRRIWNEAIERYPVPSDTQMGWISSIYRSLFQLIQEDDPFEAQRFARRAVDQFGETPSALEWFKSYRQQSEFNVALVAADVGDHDTALEILNRLGESVSKRDSLRESVLYRRALAETATGKYAVALEHLLEVLKEGPKPIFEAAYYAAAEKSGITAEEADNRIWEARMAAAKPFEDFALKDPDGKLVRLSDYRGKVVLVNFWYPSCGPCRGEFPHLQKIVERFGDRGLTVLALNTHPKEADKVKSFLANNKYSFRALQTPTEEWSEERYGVVGTPANFLIDRKGAVVAEPRLYDEATAQRLTLLIEALLNR